jgi:Rrf2 family protein
MLTLKTRYSIYAMRTLSRAYGKGTMMIKEIAESENIPKRFLESILLELKNNGYLGSKLGKKGGYYLAKQPEKISLLEIVRLFEGTIAMFPCTSQKYYEPCGNCDDESKCQIRGVFNDIRDYTYNKMARTSFAELI